MKLFKEPFLEIVYINSCDVVITSVGTDNVTGDPGSEEPEYDDE